MASRLFKEVHANELVSGHIIKLNEKSKQLFIVEAVTIDKKTQMYHLAVLPFTAPRIMSIPFDQEVLQACTSSISEASSKDEM